MDKVTNELVTIEQIVHHFYCDKCGEFICSSEECDDGYVPNDPGGINIPIRFDNKWLYYRKKHACSKCRQTIIKQINDGLIAIGFKEEED